MIHIKKCSRCGCYTESEAIIDDEAPYIICQHCGFLMDVPAGTLTDAPKSKNENNIDKSEGVKMTQEKVNEIMSMFPADKPVCFNYYRAREIVLELLQELQISRILNIVVNQRNYDDDVVCTWVNMFRVRDDIEDPEKAFRSAIIEYCMSNEGTDMVRYACGKPNWGDINSESPDDFLKDRGFFSLGDSIDMVVDHDEIIYTSDIDED